MSNWSYFFFLCNRSRSVSHLSMGKTMLSSGGKTSGLFPFGPGTGLGTFSTVLPVWRESGVYLFSETGE